MSPRARVTRENTFRADKYHTSARTRETRRSTPVRCGVRFPRFPDWILVGGRRTTLGLPAVPPYATHEKLPFVHDFGPAPRRVRDRRNDPGAGRPGGSATGRDRPARAHDRGAPGLASPRRDDRRGSRHQRTSRRTRAARRKAAAAHDHGGGDRHWRRYGARRSPAQPVAQRRRDAGQPCRRRSERIRG
jgi:hypothetical protein